MIQDYKTPLCCVYKQVSNWMLSSASDLALLELMQLITSLNIKIYCYLRSSPRIVGDEVSSQWLWALLIKALTFSNRCACCLDANVKRDDTNNHFLCQMGQGRKSIHPAQGDYDWSRSSTDRRTTNHLSAEPALSLQVAYATHDPKPLCNDPISSTVGKDQEMGHNLTKFLNLWDDIWRDPSTPQSLVNYLEKEWLHVLHLWSGTARRGLSIFEEGNTNMLLEAYVVYLFTKIINWSNLRYHHVLKSHCLDGKHNRWIDYIIQALVFDFLSDVENRHKRQIIGLEGPDLEDTRRQQILTTARNISPDSIKKVNDNEFVVASESIAGHRYMICYDPPTCRAPTFYFPRALLPY